MFTDYYAEQSCTAGRASFITGQSGLRTGLTKVGLPGATLGLQKEDPTIAELLKPQGYATGQFGKNNVSKQIAGNVLCALGDFATSPVVSTTKHFKADYDKRLVQITR